MFKVGQIFLSKSALVRCLSEPIAIANPQGGFTLDVNKQCIKPNMFDSKHDSTIGQLPVYDGVKKLGEVNCINNDESRKFSFWKLTHVSVDGSGCGSVTWARFYCKAVRVDPQGDFALHESGEVVEFSSAGTYTIPDLEFIRQVEQAA